MLETRPILMEEVNDLLSSLNICMRPREVIALIVLAAILLYALAYCQRLIISLELPDCWVADSDVAILKLDGKHDSLISIPSVHLHNLNSQD